MTTVQTWTLVSVVTTFGRLLATSRNQKFWSKPKYVPHFNMLFCCLWKTADNFQKPNFLPKAKIWSKCQDFIFCRAHFRLRVDNPQKTKYPAQNENMLQTIVFAVYCEHFCNHAANSPTRNILPKAKLYSKHENFVFARITFWKAAGFSQNQISCREQKYAPQIKISGLLRLLFEVCEQLAKTKYRDKSQNLLQTWKYLICCEHFWRGCNFWVP